MNSLNSKKSVTTDKVTIVIHPNLPILTLSELKNLSVRWEVRHGLIHPSSNGPKMILEYLWEI